MQVAFYISGMIVALVTLVTASVRAVLALEGIRTDIAVVRAELHNIKQRVEQIEKRYESPANS